jgi:hypothetical protein
VSGLVIYNQHQEEKEKKSMITKKLNTQLFSVSPTVGKFSTQYLDLCL